MSTRKPGSGEHPAVANYHATLSRVREAAEDRMRESRRRIDELLREYVNEDARRTSPSVH
jgi:hypothetical protein